MDRIEGAADAARSRAAAPATEGAGRRSETIRPAGGCRRDFA
ncbi:hypothetical protein [Anaerotruncus colihominis]|uniref:Uncharacterized protein n=1 Tax=Anaerotruncus colihominis DSM 17241 TaxID=445972 RepID=B0PG34_9FIRM|nr:hypothetical protein [Anaerotruncus colihominis]EDS09622.1 hypothetical protein ANACOL_03766 [Anaerotruncus colihominis DSM 17241]MCQ4732949.1 hypothetical protein [Anaerotruncus colihominis]UWN74653.1 hypothetical protein NQ528_15965 [Anaerotruncus colihominis]